MESFLWHLANRTAETQFIFNLFHLLLSGLTLVVLFYQLQRGRRGGLEAVASLLPLGFSLLVLDFALRTLYFGAGFFFRKELMWAGFDSLSHGLQSSGLLVLAAAYRSAQGDGDAPRAARWILRGTAVVFGLVLFDLLLSAPQSHTSGLPHSGVMLGLDSLAFLAVGVGIYAVQRGEWEGQRPSLVALGLLAAVFLLHGTALFLTGQTEILVWNAEQHMLSMSLFAFAWAAGERSPNLLERIFVRLNLTFIVLASLIMLVTAGMEKYQYLRLAKERSMNLAEFLRGHLVYYQARGEGLEEIFHHREVLKRVVVEFGTLPELREVNVYLAGRRASFRYTKDWEIQEEIVSLAGARSSEAQTEPANNFQMIRLPVGQRNDPGDRIEFVGTMDYVNAYIGKYIILIYSLFTVMVGLASGIIGIIVTDTDRRLRQQYEELQETHQQLAQAAKLASVGQLAGGVAHEINTPITSILSLATHLGEGKSATALTPGQRRSLQVIAEQAERASKIVRNLLFFSRQSHLELRQVNLREVIEAAIALVEYRVGNGAIRLRLEIDAGLPPVLGDGGRLTEVFVNLLNNALDAMPHGGMVVVRAFGNPGPDGGVRVEVEDTGCGIPPEHLPRIFDPFFTTKEPGRGTGLGLSISHGIVKDHGGQISAQRRLEGGTTIAVTLPKEVS